MLPLSELVNHYVNGSGLQGAAQQQQQISGQNISAPERAQRPDTNPETSRQEQRAEDDLKAQQEMAEWAFWMVIASTFGVGITAIGVVYVALTLAETRAAVVAANEATKAAHETNKITREFGNIQLRAYVSVSGQELQLEGGFPYPIITMKNFGNTPAVDVFGYCILTIREFPLESDLMITACEPHKMSQSVIGPGSTLKLSYPDGQLITGDVQSEIRQGKAGIYVYGELIYKDVFGESHTSKYCLVCSGSHEFTHRILVGYYQGNKIT